MSSRLALLVPVAACLHHIRDLLAPLHYVPTADSPAAVSVSPARQSSSNFSSASPSPTLLCYRVCTLLPPPLSNSCIAYCDPRVFGVRAVCRRLGLLNSHHRQLLFSSIKKYRNGDTPLYDLKECGGRSDCLRFLFWRVYVCVGTLFTSGVYLSAGAATVCVCLCECFHFDLRFNLKSPNHSRCWSKCSPHPIPPPV